MIMSPSFLYACFMVKEPAITQDWFHKYAFSPNWIQNSEPGPVNISRTETKQISRGQTNNQSTQSLVDSSLEQVLEKEYHWDQTGVRKRRVLPIKLSRAPKSENWMSHDQPTKEWARGECEMTEEKVSVIA